MGKWNYDNGTMLFGANATFEIKRSYLYEIIYFVIGIIQYHSMLAHTNIDININNKNIQKILYARK